MYNAAIQSEAPVGPAGAPELSGPCETTPEAMYVAQQTASSWRHPPISTAAAVYSIDRQTDVQTGSARRRVGREAVTEHRTGPRRPPPRTGQLTCASTKPRGRRLQRWVAVDHRISAVRRASSGVRQHSVRTERL